MIVPVFELYAATGFTFTLTAGPDQDDEDSPVLLNFFQNSRVQAVFTLNEYGSSKARDLTGHTVTAHFVKQYPTYVELAAIVCPIQGDPVLGQVLLDFTPTFSDLGQLELVEVDGQGKKTKFFPAMQFKGTPSQT